MILDRFFGAFSHDMGIDLGTANTLVFVQGRGIVINEPSVVAVNARTDQILAIGAAAREMVGKTPAHIIATRPLVDGVVSDFEVTEQMLKYFINRVHQESFSFFPRPRVVIGIPSGVTEVEKRAVEDAARNAGARQVYLIEEPMAAAIGADLPVNEPAGSMIVDIGGGTCEVAVISLGGVVVSKSLRVAGDKLNQDIIQYARERYNLLLGERTAEAIKIEIGAVYGMPDTLSTVARGRDIVTGLPKEVMMEGRMVQDALEKSASAIAESVKSTIEQTPPELVADIMRSGIVLAGGGALLRGLDRLIADRTQMPVYIADDPLTCVARGTGMVLEYLDTLRGVLVSSTDIRSPRSLGSR